MGLDWFIGNAAFFVKTGKNKSGMSPEFCLCVIGGKTCCFIQLVIENKARICFLVRVYLHGDRVTRF